MPGQKILPVHRGAAAHLTAEVAVVLAGAKSPDFGVEGKVGAVAGRKIGAQFGLGAVAVGVLADNRLRRKPAGLGAAALLLGIIWLLVRKGYQPKAGEALVGRRSVANV